MQLKDVDIRPVITAYEDKSDERPNWNSISEHSGTTKAYFAEWNRLTVINGVLYRIWESANGVNKCHQVIDVSDAPTLLPLLPPPAPTPSFQFRNT